MMALFVWGRLRYDLVALLALLAGIGAGHRARRQAFSGFADDIVIIVGKRAGGQRRGRALRRDGER